eukprot:XP_017446538.1 PREDICTED: mitochondrial import inner membrane translocase subunit TIM14 isoform X1 [Rattus norvegicus]
MASPAPVRPFSQPQLLGPFLQHFVRQFRRTLRRPCRVARRCGSGGSAGSALSFYSSVLWRWARAGMSPRCRAAKWSHGKRLRLLEGRAVTPLPPPPHSSPPYGGNALWESFRKPLQAPFPDPAKNLSTGLFLN